MKKEYSLKFNVASSSVQTSDGNKNVSDVFFFALGNGIGAHYEYAPFGAITRTSSATHIGNVDIVADNPFRFSSEFYDSELDLVYYNYRHYSPALGRFLSRDPIEEQGGLNLYAFCKNSVTYIFETLGKSCRHSAHKEKNGKKIGRTGIANESAPRVNGCGSSGSEWVPDSFFWIVDFSKACNEHDRCYGTCGADKARCDINLGIDMADACLRTFAAFAFLPSWGKTPLLLCLAQATIYSATLLSIAAADKAFEEAQDTACLWEECCCEAESQ